MLQRSIIKWLREEQKTQFFPVKKNILRSQANFEPLRATATTEPVTAVALEAGVLLTWCSLLLLRGLFGFVSLALDFVDQHQ